MFSSVIPFLPPQVRSGCEGSAGAALRRVRRAALWRGGGPSSRRRPVSPSNAQGIGGFVNGAKALVDPALVMTAAVAPLALIAGGLVLLFGGRRGMQIIGTSLGVLLLLGSVTALIN